MTLHRLYMFWQLPRVYNRILCLIICQLLPLIASCKLAICYSLQNCRFPIKQQFVSWTMTHKCMTFYLATVADATHEQVESTQVDVNGVRSLKAKTWRTAAMQAAGSMHEWCHSNTKCSSPSNVQLYKLQAANHAVSDMVTHDCTSRHWHSYE